MVNIKINIDGEKGTYTASGHCDPVICTVVCTLEDALDANLRRHGLLAEGMIEDGERKLRWEGAGSKALAEFAAVAFEELADSQPEQVTVEVDRHDDH